MSDTQDVIDRYFEMWNEDDDGRRLAICETLWTDDGVYTDPLADVTGPAAISAMVGELRASHAGYSLRQSSPLDLHHDRVRFHWQILDADDQLYLEGVDVGLVADGRLRSISGFFGAVPAEAAA